MRRILIAILLVLHGLAHSAAGVWAMSLGPAWAVVPLWLVAEAGFVAAGLGLAGVPGLRGHWQPVAFFAGVSSVALLASFGTFALIAGLLFDVLLLVLATALAERSDELAPRIEPRLPNVHRHRGVVAAATVSWIFLGWLALVIVSRPWYTAWGVNEAERVELRTGRALVLENQGAVVVQPLGANSPRLHLRPRGAGNPSLAAVALGPVTLLVFEPARFIMQRRMLLGIRDRAEGRIPGVGVSPPSA